ncbi:LysR family transcriptional regulator [Shumkonia mesophila]|uniref:LysR family transcriptional regulator n=1 Tax=Shumkonia mesophila TaxID=2838854 RepID=UPI002934F5FC|nr:LysR family transcriptional regulator [Shumkonia mesophila]
MDIRKMESLVAIADHGSFTKAAKAVNLTQSAVSQQVHELENLLGVPLFSRDSRPPKLTRHGQAYVETARAMLALHRTFLETHCRSEVKGTLVVGTVRSALTGVLPRALRTLKQSFPNLSLRLINSGRLSNDLTQDVRNGQLDAALIVGPPAADDELVWRAYAMERFFVIAPADAPGTTDADLLSAGPYLRFIPNLPIERRIDREIEKRNLAIVPEMELDTFESILLMVSAGLGTGVVPELYIREAARDRIRAVPFGDASFYRELGVVTLRRGKKMALVEALLSALVQPAAR